MSGRQPVGRGPGGGPPGMMGMPPAKSKDFKGTLKRLLAELSNERKIITGVIALITTSVTIGAFGPKILGRATNYIFMATSDTCFHQAFRKLQRLRI